MQLMTGYMTMGDAEKPFACQFHGCGMKFVLEDHLTQHKKKHEMSLTLAGFPPCKTAYVDQTPTPTRFIKNCDAVGLFQDLQHLNPFDEEFRKASNSGCIPQAGDRSLDSEDSLNTPNIIPLTTERQVVQVEPDVELVFPNDEEMPDSQPILTPATHKEKKKTPSPVKANLSQPTSVITHGTNIAVPVLPKKVVTTTVAPVSVVIGRQNDVSTVSANHVPAPVPIITSTKPETVQQVSTIGAPVTLIIKLDGQVPYLPAIAPQPVVSTVNKIPLGGVVSQVPATVKLKTAISNRMSKVTPCPDTTNLNNNRNLAVVQPTLQAALQGRRRQEEEENPDEKRLKFLERNRAAAARCRTRKKQWVVNLQRKADELASTNELLQREVALLRNEVAKLKTMLLAHKDCPVTQQQRAAGNADALTLLCPPLLMAENINHTDSGIVTYPNLSVSNKVLDNGTIFVDTIEVEISSSESSCDGKSLPGSSE